VDPEPLDGGVTVITAELNAAGAGTVTGVVTLTVIGVVLPAGV
jgi:hypothetical protein